LCIFFFGNFSWSSRQFQVNECCISNHLKVYNHHHLTDKHSLYKDQLLSSNICVSFSPVISTTSYPRSISFYWHIMCWSSWHLQANGCEATSLQIKQVRPKQKVCTLSTNFRWCSLMTTSDLLWQSLKNR
jgi:hypothetical protein